MEEDYTPEEVYNRYWKGIIENSDGSINKEQLILELKDYHDMINRMTKLTYSLTNGMLSYPNYPVDTILEIHQEILENE